MSSTNKEGVLARIRALAAKTTANGCTEAEANAAAEMVDRLLAQYELTLDEVAIRADTEMEMIEIENLARHPVRYAALRIAEFCDCKTWTLEQRDLVMLGSEVDVSIAEYLALLFMRAIDRESGGFSMFNPDYALSDRARQDEMTFSFQVGMATRLGERLVELKGKRDFSQRKTGFDLVAAKKPLVDAAFASLGITLGRARGGGSVRRDAAYLAGRGAAEGVAIGQGVAGRASDRGKLR